MSLENKQNSRRQFLRNTALATLSGGLLPSIVKSNVSLHSKSSSVCNPTTLDYYGQGPFYTANAPTIINNQLASLTEPGTRLILSGIVQTIDCSAVIPNTLIDVWHANNAGVYDNTGFTVLPTDQAIFTLKLLLRLFPLLSLNSIFKATLT
jgi:protocatechuate 3,4-dioxygenase beta subunit